MKNPLRDKIFLQKLDKNRNKIIYAKITVLDFNENPKEEITGRVTSGSISVDGSSAVRRTCSLTLVAKDINMSNYIWGVNSKFKLEIGLTNNIDSQYPKIIWFKQGTFLITSYNCSVSLNSYTISIQGKDKMALLNGDIGGILTPLATNFSDIDTVEYLGDGSIATVTTTKIPIKKIILDAVHEFAREPWWNIVVNDLDDYGLELLEYQGNGNIYLFITEDANTMESGAREVAQVYFDEAPTAGNNICEVFFKGFPNTTFDITKLEEQGGCYDNLLDESSIGREFIQEVSSVCFAADLTKEEYKNNQDKIPAYTVFKGDKGAVVGYRLTDITYPGELTLSAGSSLTQMLDKLVAMLGNFEYFYDIDGRFVFQKKKTYVDVNWNSINGEHDFSTETYAENALYTSKEVYRFEDDYLLSSFQNTPNLSNLKNDFTVWGNQEVAGVTVPIHVRYAIDHRPVMYKPIGYSELTDYDEKNNKLTYREITYEEAGIYKPEEDKDNDYNLKNFLKNNALLSDDNENKVIYCIKTVRGFYIEPDWTEDSIYSTQFTYYQKTVDDKTKKDYELIFITSPDVSYKKNTSKSQIVFVVDWREIIYQMAMDYHAHNYESDFLKKVAENNLMEDGTPYYPSGYTGYEQYYIDFKTAVTKVQIDISTNVYQSMTQTKQMSYWREVYNPCLKIREHAISKMDELWLGVYDYRADGWRADLQENPQLVHFWFDFLDSYGEINRYAVQNIGVRSKVVNDNNIKSIYYREIPNVIYRMESEQIDTESTLYKNEQWVKPGYVYFSVGTDKMGAFRISAQGKSAVDVLKEWLSDYTYCTESVSFSSIPVYYLEPNTIATMKDNETGISGQYIIKQFTIPLGSSGQMSVTATKIMQSTTTTMLGEETAFDTTTIIDTNKATPELLEVYRPEFIASVRERTDEGTGTNYLSLYIDQKQKPEKDADIRIADNRLANEAAGINPQEWNGILYIDNAHRLGNEDEEGKDEFNTNINNFFENERFKDDE